MLLTQLSSFKKRQMEWWWFMYKNVHTWSCCSSCHAWSPQQNLKVRTSNIEKAQSHCTLHFSHLGIHCIRIAHDACLEVTYKNVKKRKMNRNRKTCVFGCFWHQGTHEQVIMFFNSKPSLHRLFTLFSPAESTCDSPGGEMGLPRFQEKMAKNMSYKRVAWKRSTSFHLSQTPMLRAN